jgi:nucleotide-binding universal stress UspA family protein
MAYKTVLVHCNDKARLSRVLDHAAEVAGAFQAHLIGLSVTPPAVIVPAGMPGAPETVVVDEHCRVYRQGNPEMKAAFEAAGRARSLPAEWREVDAGARNVADVAIEHAHAADLVVAAQTDRTWAGSGHLDVADQLVMESGRPVLIVPNEGKRRELGRKILLAWNARREAARAAFDALPLLERAAEVKCIWINPQSEETAARDVPAADICEALARHGVKCEATEAVRPYSNVGRTLLASAEDFGADLLVMGCYGHSRLREFVLGGASEHVLKNMTIPVLMSH